MVPREKMRRLIILMDYQTAEILHYIYYYNEYQKKKEPEDRKGLTKDMVARRMQRDGVCSRLTTLRILKDLLNNETIIDTRDKEKAFSRLEINEKINWVELRKELLEYQIKKVLLPFNKIINQDELTIKIKWNKEGIVQITIK
jgi:hypothetical protein